MVVKLPKSNIDKNGLIRKNEKIVSSIKGSSVQDDTIRYVGNLVNYSKSEIWCSKPLPNSYFVVDFIKPIFITNYTFEVYDWGALADYPKAWEGVGTLNEEERTFASVNNSGINQSNRVKTFQTSTTGPFKSIKFTHVGVDFGGNYYFCLGKFDVFGFFESDVYHRSMCAYKKHPKTCVLFVVLMCEK